MNIMIIINDYYKYDSINLYTVHNTNLYVIYMHKVIQFMIYLILILLFVSREIYF